MAWTFERVELLITLWKSGNSASQIAHELGEGVSRNAVIGKIHRLGLSERNLNSKDSSDYSLKQSLSNKEKKLDPLITKKGAKFSDISADSTIKAKTGKKRGRKPSNKNIEKGQNNIDLNTTDESVSSDGALNFPGISGASELDKEALADMI